MAGKERAPRRRNIENSDDSSRVSDTDSAATLGDKSRRADGSTKSASRGGREFVESWDESALMRRNDEYGEVY